MPAGELPSEWLQLVKDISRRRKTQPKAVRKISHSEEANALDGGGPVGPCLEAVEQGRKASGPGLA